MPAQWTAEIVGKMHLHGIKRSDMAEELKCTPEYVSAVLNGKRHPKDAETKFRAAVDSLLSSFNSKLTH